MLCGGNRAGPYHSGIGLNKETLPLKNGYTKKGQVFLFLLFMPCLRTLLLDWD